MRFIFTLFLILSPWLHAEEWQPYPAYLPVFDYSHTRLQHNWHLLNSGPGLPFPDEQWVSAMLERYPLLLQRTLELAHTESAHPAVKAFRDQHLTPMTLAIQDVWRLHYQGQFQQAYELGMSLGPLGAIPALYSKLMYATLVVTDAETKMALFKESSVTSEALLPLAADYSFARFGLAYAHARMLELMSSSQATGSGYLGETQDTLRQLIKEAPANAMYPAMLGGMHAGVVERVGSLIGRMTYGATESRAIDAFEKALANNDQLPVIYFEYAKALGLMDADEYHDKRLELLTRCSKIRVYSAEEALNQQACSSTLDQLQQEQPHD